MPRAEIASKQAVYTLGLLHAELAGKLLANKREAIRLRTAMMQVEAVVKMLQPGFNVASIAAKRRNKSNPWFKRGTLFRSAVDVLRRAGTPGAGDCRRPDSRQGPSGDPQASHRLTGGYPCRLAEAQRRGGCWGRGACPLALGADGGGGVAAANVFFLTISRNRCNSRS
jgi:hypothetical protein